MDIVETTGNRLLLVSRPWGPSLTYLGVALVWTWASFGSDARADVPATAIWIMVVAAIACWVAFFIHAQRTEITFDRRAGTVLIARHRLFSRTGTVFPLSVLAGVTAQRVAPIRRWPWQFRLVAIGHDDAFGQGKILVPGLMRETRARAAAAAIARWLDRGNAAA